MKESIQQLREKQCSNVLHHIVQYTLHGMLNFTHGLCVWTIMHTCKYTLGTKVRHIVAVITNGTLNYQSISHLPHMGLEDRHLKQKNRRTIRTICSYHFEKFLQGHSDALLVIPMKLVVIDWVTFNMPSQWNFVNVETTINTFLNN